MTQEQFNAMMELYLAGLRTQAPSDWSAKARIWAEQNGLIRGDAEGNMQYKAFCTREQLAEILFRFSQL